MDIPGGASTLHMLRDSHKGLDVCLELSHTTLDLTTLIALLLLLLPYASLILCLSETPCPVPKAPKEAGSREHAHGVWAQLGMDEGCGQHLDNTLSRDGTAQF